MKTLYLDCFAGIAGDMFIGALLNLVPSPVVLIEGIKKIKALNPEEYELVIEHANKNGIAGINFDVKLNNHEHHHHEHAHEHEHDEHSHVRVNYLSASNENQSERFRFWLRQKLMYTELRPIRFIFTRSEQLIRLSILSGHLSSWRR